MVRSHYLQLFLFLKKQREKCGEMFLSPQKNRKLKNGYPKLKLTHKNREPSCLEVRLSGCVWKMRRLMDCCLTSKTLKRPFVGLSSIFLFYYFNFFSIISIAHNPNIAIVPNSYYYRLYNKFLILIKKTKARSLDVPIDFIYSQISFGIKLNNNKMTNQYHL